MLYPTTTRLYEIVHVPSGRRYTGISEDDLLTIRWPDHIRRAVAGMHGSPAFQALWRSTPPNEWIFKSLAVGNDKVVGLEEREIVYKLSRLGDALNAKCPSEPPARDIRTLLIAKMAPTTYHTTMWRYDGDGFVPADMQSVYGSRS